MPNRTEVTQPLSRKQSTSPGGTLSAKDDADFGEHSAACDPVSRGLGGIEWSGACVFPRLIAGGCCRCRGERLSLEQVSSERKLAFSPCPWLQVLLCPAVSKGTGRQSGCGIRAPQFASSKLEQGKSLMTLEHSLSLSHFQGGLRVECCARLKALQMQFISAILLGSMMLYHYRLPYKARRAVALSRTRSVLRLHLVWAWSQ